jgi:hypothetical protein
MTRPLERAVPESGVIAVERLGRNGRLKWLKLAHSSGVELSLRISKGTRFMLIFASSAGPSLPLAISHLSLPIVDLIESV